jgi:hypothetical protein
MTSTQQFEFPSLIDNTMRTSFVRCETKWKNNFGLQLTAIKRSIHLHAGGAFAAGLEATRKAYFDEGLAEEEARARGVQAITTFYGLDPGPCLLLRSISSFNRLARALQDGQRTECS